MLVISTSLSIPDLQSIKASVREFAPSIKSSHRCEALARGLGFGTYSSLLAAARSQSSVPVTVNVLAYRGYLSEHGFEAPDASICRAIGRVALEKVLTEFPDLTADGMGVYARGSWGFETLADYQARQMESRKQMSDDKADERFLLACAFVQRIPKTTTIRHGVGFRRLKHIAENMTLTLPGGEYLGPQYLPAGFLLAAAIHAGFKWKMCRGLDGVTGPEVRFNMLKSAVNDLDVEVGQSGYAEDRRRALRRRGAQ